MAVVIDNSAASVLSALVPALPPFDLPTFIAGDEVHGNERFVVRYPYTGEVIGSAPRLRRADVVRALEFARDQSFDLTRHERAQLLFAIADRLESEAASFARLITWESGLSLKDTTY